ncbi:hypothetical protein FACS1894169_15620 [Bacteroidia bacterium]|nr:hypothetical protein FACS1894169_15620 [Bacteroidia bacterium]
MKQTLKLFLFLLMATSLNAQKNVNIDSHRFRLSYRSFPDKAQTPKFFYYSKLINMPGETQESLSNIDDLYDALQIQGQRFVTDNKDSDFSITVNLLPVSFSVPEVNERVEEIKDRDGKITGRNHYYSVIVAYSFNANALFKQGDKLIINQPVFNKFASSLKYQTKEYSTLKDANNNWKLQRDDVYAKIRNDLAFEAIKNATFTFSRLYGFAESTSSEMIKTINEKKHPENEKLREMADNLKSKLESMNPNSGLTEADVEEELNYFKELPKRYTDPKLKADVKLRYVGYYNVAKIYFYLDQPEKVAEYADLLFANDHDKNDGKKMKEEAAKLIESFNAMDIKTRHFNTDNYFVD